ncbi:ImmA/IrrE family metallo-endopeptidase [Phragmitibacter flavus]|uniref:ImmA/IrrE family metallo-endopeptidase n=1 Tax=Phragmitibacter flavus TaxID=2576071 RepID=A0A5R8KGE0_9BACT|nr:ImmA/IrrE family metallo-endopeptidase [Phragmitibacter flavus]TLD71364.1 ImmA/IrrE family metallo-endopeptidase [Phragmitibacter flavus]
MREPNLISAQGHAFKLNKRYGGKMPGALEMEDLAMALNVLVVPYGIKGAAARLVRDGDDGLLRLNANLSTEGARRFAIAHELGHWQMHRTESQMFLCTNENFRDYYGSPLEREANYFASELLMPSVFFRLLTEKAEPDLKRISEWSEVFRTSLTAACLRFLRDTKFDCIAASVRNGRVEWSWRKESGRRVWLNNGQRIEPGSLAWEIANGRVVGDTMEVVDPQAWFSHLPFRYSGELQEQCIHMPRYGRIFCLLWMV